MTTSMQPTDIHPTFVQTLSEDDRYDQFQAFKILEFLRKKITHLVSS